MFGIPPLKAQNHKMTRYILNIWGEHVSLTRTWLRLWLCIEKHLAHRRRSQR